MLRYICNGCQNTIDPSKMVRVNIEDCDRGVKKSNHYCLKCWYSVNKELERDRSNFIGVPVESTEERKDAAPRAKRKSLQEGYSKLSDDELDNMMDKFFELNPLKKRSVPEKELREVLRKFNEGYSLKEITDTVACSTTPALNVCNAFREFVVGEDSDEKEYRELSLLVTEHAVDTSKLFALYAAKWPISEIAAEFGIEEELVVRIIDYYEKYEIIITKIK